MTSAAGTTHFVLQTLSCLAFLIYPSIALPLLLLSQQFLMLRHDM